MTKTLITVLSLFSLALPALACAQEAHPRPPSMRAAHAPPHPRTAGATQRTPAGHAHEAAGVAPAASPHARPPAATAVEGQVNLNTATADELMRIPGIGPVKAQAILATRARQPGGRFYHLEDVMRVRGIGRGTLRRLRDILVLTGPTTLRAVAPAAAHGVNAATTSAPSHDGAGPRVRSDDDI